MFLAIITACDLETSAISLSMHKVLTVFDKVWHECSGGIGSNKYTY